MTDTTIAQRPDRGLAQRLWLWLPRWRRRLRQTTHVDSLSDRMLADIGIDRDAINRAGPNTLHEAMRFSG